LHILSSFGMECSDIFIVGCDIINLSLGSSSNWAEDPTAIVANRISEKGSIGKNNFVSGFQYS
jgi:hypothetical protein